MDWTYYFNDFWMLPLLCLLFMAGMMILMMFVCRGMMARGCRHSDASSSSGSRKDSPAR